MLTLNVGFYVGGVTRRQGAGGHGQVRCPLALSGSTAMIRQTVQQVLQMSVDEINAQGARPHHKQALRTT
jgi:hypothetical protein